MSTETIEFQAEARQLLQLMIHSIYSTKDVFLRKLISNASDALDKLRLAAYCDKDLEVDTSDLHIELSTDPAERTLTVRDNGIGMTRDEVVDLIGTIAKSETSRTAPRIAVSVRFPGVSTKTTSYGSSRRRVSVLGSVFSAKSKGSRSPARAAHMVVDCWGSTSTTSTRAFLAATAARFIRLVVFPTPPF